MHGGAGDGLCAHLPLRFHLSCGFIAISQYCTPTPARSLVGKPRRETQCSQPPTPLLGFPGGCWRGGGGRGARSRGRAEEPLPGPSAGQAAGQQPPGGAPSTRGRLWKRQRKPEVLPPSPLASSLGRRSQQRLLTRGPDGFPMQLRREPRPPPPVLTSGCGPPGLRSGSMRGELSKGHGGRPRSNTTRGLKKNENTDVHRGRARWGQREKAVYSPRRGLRPPENKRVVGASPGPVPGCGRPPDTVAFSSNTRTVQASVALPARPHSPAGSRSSKRRSRSWWGRSSPRGACWAHCGPQGGR